ncbi:ACT domain-containing protein [Maridesulfovibrio sp.]|uniref:ACT domain-containing protein n=1 Tax=Maridesulfovibrio sp. TaxID=2795000 RepID=UPI0039F0C75E
MILKLLPPSFTICKLSPKETIPDWAIQSEYFFLAKTSDELSIICSGKDIPEEVKGDKGWRCFRVDGDLEFDQIGVVASVSAPIANAGISLFLVSTHDRDYVFVHKDNLTQSIQIYQEHGFAIEK